MTKLARGSRPIPSVSDFQSRRLFPLRIWTACEWSKVFPSWRHHEVDSSVFVYFSDIFHVSVLFPPNILLSIMRAIWRLQHCKNVIPLNKISSQTLPLGLFSFRVATCAKSHISTASFVSPSKHRQTVMSESKPQEEAKPVENAETKTEEELPPLSDHEFKIYNRAADHMEYFVSLTSIYNRSHSLSNVLYFSTTTFEDHGTSYGMPVPTTVDPKACH